MYSARTTAIKESTYNKLSSSVKYKNHQFLNLNHTFNLRDNNVTKKAILLKKRYEYLND